MTWKIHLPMLPASMNARERSSFWARKKELDEITQVVDVLSRVAKIPVATSRRRVTITIHKSKRSRVRDDPANRDSRAKAPLDALVRLGLLVDDSEKWLDWGGVVEGEKRVEKETVIEIEDCE